MMAAFTAQPFLQRLPVKTVSAVIILVTSNRFPMKVSSYAPESALTTSRKRLHQSMKVSL